MMLKAIIIEDEQHAAAMLAQMIEDIDNGIEILDKCPDLPSGVKSIQKYKPDIVFLDIELPVYSGIQLLDFFDPADITFDIVFTTASNEYAIRAFEMSAVDYLMKPIQEEKLKATIEKISRKHSTLKKALPVLKQNLQQQNRKIVVPISSGIEILNLDDICYLKAEGSYTHIYFHVQNPLLVSKNLKHFEFILTGVANFIRIHRSFIVNLNFAKKLLKTDGGTLYLEDNTELPVSEERQRLILEMLQNM